MAAGQSSYFDVDTDEGCARALRWLEELQGSPDLLDPILALLLRAVRAMGQPSSLRAWLARITPGARDAVHRELIVACHVAALRILEQVDDREWFSLDACVREFHVWRHVPDGTRFAAAAEGPHPDLIMGLISGHPNGFERQAAVERLCAMGAQALPWLLVRSVDWVEPVRVRARAGVRACLVDENASRVIGLLPLIDRWRGFSRAHSLADEIEAFLLRQSDETLMTGLLFGDPRSRRYLLALLTRHGRATPGPLSVLARSHDVVLRSMAADAIFADSSIDLDPIRAGFLDDPRGALRALALDYFARRDRARMHAELWAGVHDAHRRVREIARRHLGRGHDFLELARRALRGDEVPTVGAVRALEELGHPRDWELLVRALDGPTGVAKAALPALKRLERNATRELRLMMVGDTRSGVSRVAARGLIHEVWASDAPHLDAFLASEHLHVRRHALPLVARLPGWAGVLRLIEEHEPALRDAASSALAGWFRTRQVRLAPPEPALMPTVRARLKSSSLDPRVTHALSDWLDAFAMPQ